MLRSRGRLSPSPSVLEATHVYCPAWVRDRCCSTSDWLLTITPADTFCRTSTPCHGGDAERDTFIICFFSRNQIPKIKVFKNIKILTANYNSLYYYKCGALNCWRCHLVWLLKLFSIL